MRKKIAVVGGANMDIGGFPHRALVAGDSNPGRVRMSAGGVGRNIAENLVRLGMTVELVTAVGDDANGHSLLEDCRYKGIGTSAIQIEPEESTSVYLFVDDVRGDMSVAVNDMAIQERITPDSLAPKLEMLNSMDALVLDANLPETSIHYLAREVRVPIFADAVSAAKVGKLRGVLNRIYAFKPNRIEAQLLTGISINGVVDAAQAAQKLLEMGVGRVNLTMGVQGAICAEEGNCIYLPGSERDMVNASGAGDAFTAAMVWSWSEGLSLRESGVAGMAAAGIAMDAISAVNPDMCPLALRERMDRLRRSMNV